MRSPPRAVTAATLTALAGACFSDAARARPDGTLFPAVIPLSTLDGAIGFTLNGVATSDRSGYSVAPAGDINGDGVGDLLIGAPLAAPGGRTYAGSTYVVFGKNTASAGAFPASIELSALNGTTGFRLDGAAANDYSGRSVAGAGDVNGDGVGDLLIGVTHADPGGRDRAGSTYVVFGKNTASAGAFPASIELSALNGTTGFRLDGAAQVDYSGSSVACAGDVNGDGVDDLLIGAPSADPGGRTSAGSTYVVFGKNTASAGAFPASIELSALNGTTGFRLDGAAQVDQSGSSVACAGDINGDGVDDLLIGAPAADPGGLSGAGSTYIVFGKNTASAGAFPAALELASLDGATGFRLGGAAVIDLSGESVASAGDVNGDGVGDLLIGAPNADPGGRDRAGSTYVVFGKNTASAGAFPASIGLSTIDGTNGFRLDGDMENDRSGRSVAGAGDVNGDGVDDLLIGAFGADPGGRDYAGSTYVVFGKNTTSAGAFPASIGLSTIDGTNGFRLDGVEAEEYSGYSVARAGDVNGDGADDLLIGAYGADPGGRSGAGASYIVFGRAPAPPLDIARSVVAAGGGASASLTVDSAADGTPVPVFMVVGTIGQHDASVSSGGGFEVRGGFWFVPASAPPLCEGDTNGDNVVDFIDLNNILSSFGVAMGQPGFLPGADLNHDTVVDFLDLNIVLSFFGTAC